MEVRFWGMSIDCESVGREMAQGEDDFVEAELNLLILQPEM